MGYINKDKIPKSVGNMMGATLLSAISAYFEDPKHQQEFEEWKKERAADKQGGKVIPMEK